VSSTFSLFVPFLYAQLLTRVPSSYLGVIGISPLMASTAPYDSSRLGERTKSRKLLQSRSSSSLADLAFLSGSQADLLTFYLSHRMTELSGLGMGGTKRDEENQEMS